jgi:hypothetical protein
VAAGLRQRRDPAGTTGWLPGGGGHVLITSWERKWAEVAAPVEVDVLARAESVAILRDRVAGLSVPDADRLADELGDLPLAVAQAAGFMAETGMAVARYLDLLRIRAGQLLEQAVPGSYSRSLAAATGLIADRLAGDDPAAAQLARLCAFLAPEPIPGDLFTGAPGELPGDLAARVADPLAWAPTIPTPSPPQATSPPTSALGRQIINREPPLPAQDVAAAPHRAGGGTADSVRRSRRRPDPRE